MKKDNRKKSNRHKKKPEPKEKLPVQPNMYLLAKQVCTYYNSDRGDGGVYSGYTEEHLETTPYALHASQQNHLDTNTIPCYLKDPENAFTGYALWVIYGDGGTFGYTSGYMDCIGVFDTEEECQAIKKIIEEGGGGQDGDGRPYKKYMAKHYPNDSTAYRGYLETPYTSWVGYFSSLESVEYQRFIIQRP